MDTINYNLPHREYNDLHVIHLHTKVGYQVNVTILNYTSTMDLYPHCSFGGLHFSEKLSERYEDGRVVCSSYDVGRSYYSHNATLTFVYYQYKMYDFVQVTLQMTQTQCKHVEINICYFYNHCFYPLSNCNYYIFSNNKRNCNSYLKNVTTHTNASLLIRDRGIALTSNKEECILLEFVCIFENLPVNEYGHLKAPIKLPLKIILSLIDNSKIFQVKMPLYRRFLKDIFIYKEFCLKQNVSNVIYEELSYEISNVASQSSYHIRILNDKNCAKIMGYFTHQTRSWLEVLIINAKRKMFKIDTITKDYVLPNDRIMIDNKAFEMISVSTVLIFKLRNTRLQSKTGHYSMNVLVKYYFSSASRLLPI